MIISSLALLRLSTSGQRYTKVFMRTLLQDVCSLQDYNAAPLVTSMQGTPFSDICELTDVSEGIIVRTIVRLDETCREFRNAASIMGNSALFKKMEIASNAIKRDIVFAASLYVTGI